MNCFGFFQKLTVSDSSERIIYSNSSLILFRGKLVVTFFIFLSITKREDSIFLAMERFWFSFRATFAMICPWIHFSTIFYQNAVGVRFFSCCMAWTLKCIFRRKTNYKTVWNNFHQTLSPSPVLWMKDIFHFQCKWKYIYFFFKNMFFRLMYHEERAGKLNMDTAISSIPFSLIAE